MNTEQEIKRIITRDKQRDAEEAWESSITRKVSIAIVTYIVLVPIMFALDITKPFASAVIPAVAYLLSVLGLEFIKKIWIKRKI
jgi:hypothetical protein